MSKMSGVESAESFEIVSSPGEIVRVVSADEERAAETTADNDMDHVYRGMMYASLAISDDKPDTLKKVSVMNPWHEQALKTITGSLEEAHKPLTEILKTHMNLELDSHLDNSGVTKGGHFIDTQGYIAHNEDTVVLAYRCTTSAFDWMVRKKRATVCYVSFLPSATNTPPPPLPPDQFFCHVV